MGGPLGTFGGMKSAFIVGSGYTGRVLAARLAAAGWRVEAASRGGEPVAGTRVQAIDLLRPAPIDLEGVVGAVVYYLVPPLFRTYQAARPHLAPLGWLLDELRPRRIARLIYVSSTSVYGDRGGEWIDEETPPGPDSAWGQMRVDLEQVIARFGDEQGLPAQVVRLPEIYGPGRGPVQRLRRGYAPRYPDRWTNRIHLEDLVDVLHELGERDGPAQLLCSDDEPARAEQVYALAARLLGLPGVPLAAEVEGEDENRLALARDSKRCSNARLRAWLGRPLRYPTYREGLPTTV
jgi:nucleoside-diphosphate-sugar epimerase